MHLRLLSFHKVIHFHTCLNLLLQTNFSALYLKALYWFTSMKLLIGKNKVDMQVFHGKQK